MRLRAEQQRREPKPWWVKAAAAGALLCGTAVVSGCNSAPAPSNTAASALPSSPASASALETAPSSEQSLPIWRGDATGTELPFPGRVALPNDTCNTFGVNNPQGVVLDHGVLTVIDARRSVPQDCDYSSDGAGVYKGASYESGNITLPEGSHKRIPDGTVVKVVAYAEGELACNQGGENREWIGVIESPGSTQVEWLWAGNAGGAPPVEQLKAEGMQASSTPYSNAVHANC